MFIEILISPWSNPLRDLFVILEPGPLTLLSALAATNLRPVSGVIRCPRELVHEGDERRGLTDVEPHVR